MMNFSNTRISAKLGDAFLVMVLLSTVIGGFALVQRARINTNTEEIAGNWLPSIACAGKVPGLMHDLRQAEAQHAPGFTGRRG